MTDHCPDCGRPFVIAHEGAIETHCLANRKDDFLGRVMCKDNTIARLRLELAAAKAALNGLPERFSHSVFVAAGLPLEHASRALTVARRVLEDAETERFNRALRAQEAEG